MILILPPMKKFSGAPQTPCKPSRVIYVDSSTISPALAQKLLRLAKRGALSLMRRSPVELGCKKGEDCFS
jgi:hypothetical protein